MVIYNDGWEKMSDGGIVVGILKMDVAVLLNFWRLSEYFHTSGKFEKKENNIMMKWAKTVKISRIVEWGKKNKFESVNEEKSRNIGRDCLTCLIISLDHKTLNFSLSLPFWW